MAVQEDSQYPILTQIINEVQDIKNNYNSAQTNEAVRQQNETTRQQRMAELESINAVQLNERQNAFDVQLAEKALQADLITTNTNVTANTANIATHTTQITTNAANIAANAAAIANIGNATPKGTYATLAALQTAYPTGTTGIYIVTADGHWYYWNGSAWTSGGVYQSTGFSNVSVVNNKYANKSITFDKTDFLKIGKNLFNIATAIDGTLDGATGLPTGNFLTTYITSDFIKIDASSPYKISHIIFSWVFYDSTYTYISGGTSNNNSFTTPSNAVYYRFSIQKVYSNTGLVQMETGSVSTAFESYRFVLDKNTYTQDITNNTDTINGLTVGLGTPLNVGTLEKNIGEFTGHRSYSASFLRWAYEFKKVNFTKPITRIEAYATIGSLTNKNITLVILSSDRTTELYTASTTFSGSGKIVWNVRILLDILPDTFYIGYKTDGTHGIMPANGTIDAGYTTGGTYYYTSSWNLATSTYNATDIKVYTGYSAALKPHTHTMSDIADLSIATNKVVLSLPDKYDLVVGDTFELFYKGIILANDPYRYNIKVTSTKGFAYKRKYVYTPVIGDIGTQTATISLYNDDEVLLDTKTVNLIVRAKASNPISAKNVLCVGDSLTSGGQWVTELQRKLVTVDGLSNVNFIGTQGTSPAKFEGYGGWTFASYLANMTSTSIIWINGTHDKDATDQHSIYQDTNGVQWKLETIQTGKIKVIRVPLSGTMPASGTLTWVSGGTHLSNIVFTSTTPESGNPFWNENNSTVDFANYTTELGVASIDYCYVLLGWNSTGDTEATYKGYVRSFINELRADFANSKITLVGIQAPDIDGLGANYGATWNYRDTLAFVFNLNRWLKEVAAEYTNVDFINLAGQFDTEYNMQASNVSVNIRNTSLTERKGYNGVHPATEGYYQIADAAYRNIHSKL